MSTKMVSPEDQLREYLAQDLALTKLRLNESQRSMGKLFYLVMLLVFLFIICIAGFACSVIFVSKEHTKQIEALLGSGMEITTTIREDGGHVYQDGAAGNAILNSRSTISGSSITTSGK